LNVPLGLSIKRWSDRSREPEVMVETLSIVSATIPGGPFVQRATLSNWTDHECVSHHIAVQYSKVLPNDEDNNETTVISSSVKLKWTLSGMGLTRQTAAKVINPASMMKKCEQAEVELGSPTEVKVKPG
jgi:hypothetical protein